MIQPTHKQIENCTLMGWEYLGDGIFTRDNFMGYYTDYGWVKEIV